jgi:hypothetical protein
MEFSVVVIEANAGAPLASVRTRSGVVQVSRMTASAIGSQVPAEASAFHVAAVF